MNETPNPYEAPRSHFTSESEAWPLNPASKWRRLGTNVVDSLFVFFGLLALEIVALIVFGDQAAETLEGPAVLLSWLSFACFYVFFEGLWARTPGKFVFGTVVVNERGGPPSLRQVVIRTASRFIPFEPLSFLGRTGWHDGLSHTYVVLRRSV